jgi:hypothetical protein
MPLDADDICNEVEAPISDDEATPDGLYPSCRPLQHLLPQSAAQLVATCATLNGGNNLDDAIAPGFRTSANDPTTYVGLNLLGSLEPPSCFLKLRPCQLPSHSMDTGSSKPATDVPLQSEGSDLAAPDGLVGKLPPQATHVASPHTLNLNRCPELLFISNSIPPHPESHQEAADVSLHLDDGVRVQSELLLQLKISLAVYVSQPMLPNDSGRCVHRLQAHASQIVHMLTCLLLPHNGLQTNGSTVLL